ncbi:MAG: hypothetical protein AVDCRST_MAG93-1738, partial [uncultured Chloroflexia bacterium]
DTSTKLQDRIEICRKLCVGSAEARVDQRFVKLLRHNPAGTVKLATCPAPLAHV